MVKPFHAEMVKPSKGGGVNATPYSLESAFEERRAGCGRAEGRVEGPKPCLRLVSLDGPWCECGR